MYNDGSSVNNIKNVIDNQFMKIQGQMMDLIQNKLNELNECQKN